MVQSEAHFGKIESFIKECTGKNGPVNVILTGGDAGLKVAQILKIFAAPKLCFGGPKQILTFNAFKNFPFCIPFGYHMCFLVSKMIIVHILDSELINMIRVSTISVKWEEWVHLMWIISISIQSIRLLTHFEFHCI